MTSASRHGIDSTNFFVISESISAQASWSMIFKSSFLFRHRVPHFLSRIAQRCSIGLRSGLCAGHSSNSICFWIKNSFAFFDVCLGSLSCWKIKCFPNRSFLVEARRFLLRILTSQNFHPE